MPLLITERQLREAVETVVRLGPPADLEPVDIALVTTIAWQRLRTVGAMQVGQDVPLQPPAPVGERATP